MDRLVEKIERMKKTDIKAIIDRRMEEFRSFRERGDEDWFSELCFCILTANSSAELGIRIQRKHGEMFLNSDREKLAEILKREGHRFHSVRAEYICNARKFRNIKEIISGFRSGKVAREWLVKNIRGLGYKEASHFLRNVGFEDVAILDRHIINLLVENGIIERFRSLTRKRYLEIERILEDISGQTGLSLGELDLYLWYMKTGRVMK